jgi:multidrug efflux pump subunit AcrA (membrane-fusion protein)
MSASTQNAQDDEEYLRIKKMMKNIKIQLLAMVITFILFSACHSIDTNSNEETPDATTPVTLTSVTIEPIAETIELRATSQLQKKVAVKSNTNGYIDNANINIGDEVSIGQLLFTIKTKEANAIESQTTIKDTSLNFSGLLKIKAQKSGIITTLDHQKGDYVQDGDELAIISERNSLVFILEVPFELHSFVKINDGCEIVLPDNQVVKGTISTALPSVDAISQTQSFVVKPSTDLKLPENLIAKVRIVKSTKGKATILPKSAILADETQTAFWVMKLINDSTAVKIVVKKGIEENDKVEILEPQFNPSDKIIFTGNYGLADTAKISVEK